MSSTRGSTTVQQPLGESVKKHPQHVQVISLLSQLLFQGILSSAWLEEVLPVVRLHVLVSDRAPHRPFMLPLWELWMSCQPGTTIYPGMQIWAVAIWEAQITEPCTLTSFGLAPQALKHVPQTKARVCLSTWARGMYQIIFSAMSTPGSGSSQAASFHSHCGNRQVFRPLFLMFGFGWDVFCLPQGPVRLYWGRVLACRGFGGLPGLHTSPASTGELGTKAWPSFCCEISRE